MEQKHSGSKVVRVSMPVSVASNIDSLKKAVGRTLDALGCPACCSGHDILIELQRDVIFRRDLKTKPEAGFYSKRPVGAPADPVRFVGLNPKFGAEISNVFAAIDKLAELSGHVACATGCDMFLQSERIITINPAMELQEVAVRFG